jgi:ATP-dependent Clp protease ATP-binding subunit ClpA
MMFERFTKEARAAVAAAQEEARALHDERVGTPHLVLGASRSADGPAGSALRSVGLDPGRLRATIAATPAAGDRVDADALASLGIDLEQVRRRVEAAFGEGALESGGRAGRRGRAGCGDAKPFSPAAKKALELSLREALRLGHNSIGAEHVVLGALRADDPALHAVLRRCGRSPEEVRAAVLAALEGPHAAAS